MKVLVVHRHEEQIRSLKAQFRHWHVRTVNTGLDGLLAARIEVFDLVLCSAQLSVVTGIEMARSIQNLSLNQQTPIVVLADGSETPDQARLFSLLNAHILTLRELEVMDGLSASAATL